MNVSNRFFWIALGALLFAVAAVIYLTKEFITTIILSAFFAYLMVPVYSNLLRVTKNKQLSSLLSILIVSVAFLAFVFGAINALATEISDLQLTQETIYVTITNLFGRTTFVVELYFPGAITQHTDQLSQLPSAIAKWIVPKILPLANNIVSGIVSETPVLLAQFGVAVLLAYYLIIDGKNGIDKMLYLMPEKEIISKFLGELDSIYNSFFNVYFITCLITGVIAAVGFLVLGISYPFLWGMVVFVFALIPLIGAGTIYFPMSLYFLVTHEYGKCVALLIFGTIFLNLLPENIIRPRLALRGASIHPAITLLAFAAPLFVVGMVGVIVGPAVYGFLLAAYRTKIDLMEEASKDADDNENSDSLE
jgi:predicted PurR-regulated permease PerM